MQPSNRPKMVLIILISSICMVALNLNPRNVVDVRAGACGDGECIRDVVAIFWKPYKTQMKYRRCKSMKQPWIDFSAPP